MMRFPLFLVVALLACPSPTLALIHSNYKLPEEDMNRYHGDHTCNRHGYNTFKENMQRHLTYQKFKPIGYSAVPNQRTIMCPETVQDLHSSSTQSMTGYDTVWIVENTASDPVVLSYVNPMNGMEYSAMNSKIIPPQKDENAILQPGQWRAVYTWEGHVFLARQLLEDKSLGPVLMQHRTGLIPIGINAQELICPTTDPEPVVNGTRVPQFARTPSSPFRQCNTIDLGFRNMANCPLHGYYVQHQRSSMSNDDQDDIDDEPIYQEQFKFHLGMNHKKPNDFMWGWDSATKFEGTFIGHSFAFRSAADPHVLVQTYTLQPTRIPDCPNLKKKAHQVNRVTNVGMAATVVLPTGGTTTTTILETFTNATTTTYVSNKAATATAWNINGTTSHRRRVPAVSYSVDASMTSGAAVLVS